MLRRTLTAMQRSIGHYYINRVGDVMRLNNATPIIQAMLEHDDEDGGTKFDVEALFVDAPPADDGNGPTTKISDPKTVDAFFRGLRENTKDAQEWASDLTDNGAHYRVRWVSTPNATAFAGDLSILTSSMLFPFVSVGASEGEASFVLTFDKDVYPPVIFRADGALIAKATSAKSSGSGGSGGEPPVLLGFGASLTQPFSPHMLSVGAASPSDAMLYHELSPAVFEEEGASGKDTTDTAADDEPLLRPLDGALSLDAPLIAALQYDPAAQSIVWRGERVVLKSHRPTRDIDGNGNTALMRAAQSGDEEATLAAIATTMSNAADGTAALQKINHANKNGDTALMFAAARGLVTAVEAFLSAGATVDAANAAGGTPLLWAAIHGHAAIAEMLVTRSKADISIAGRDGMTPMHFAAMGGHTAIVDLLLLQPGVVVDAANAKGMTPLYVAAMNGHGDVVRTLIAAKAAVDGPSSLASVPLVAAASKGHLGVLEMLIAAAANVNTISAATNCTAMTMAADQGFVGGVDALIAAGADVNLASPTGGTALMAAAMQQHTEIALKLIASNADVNAVAPTSGRTAVMSAAHHGEMRVLGALIAAGADVNLTGDANTDGGTALIFAASGGHTEAVNALLAANANVNATSTDGSTALLYALRGDHGATGMALLAAGADPNLADANGFTPLMLACRGGTEADLALVAALIKAKAAVNAQSSDGTMPIFIAARKGLEGVLSALIAAGADVNKRSTKDQNTPLLAAAWGGEAEAVRILLSASADPNARSGDGYTPLMFACMLRPSDDQLAMVDALIAAGAEVNAISHSPEGPSGATLFGAKRDTRTPLMIATQLGSAPLVKRLLAANADVSVVASDGSTAVDWADRDDNQELSSILRAAAQ